jgi:2-polyprenyl-3-methyl-5-hydroxy-6-metoxy-1,4-benzoquinol methylase
MTFTALDAHTTASVASRNCRFCEAPLQWTFIDLGMSPLCENFLTPADLRRGEVYYPLHVYVCDRCFLVQLEEYESPARIFSNYAYFSSFSDSWLLHCQRYCYEMAERFQLTARSFVIEVASNDGYLLQYFVAQGIPVLGIEPAANVARVAVEKGIPTLVEFFSKRLAEQLVSSGRQADLVVGNNVLAQVPDLNDFVAALAMVLKPAGVLTLEFPHLLRLIEWNEFDTIYHEHFSYFSFTTAARILEAHGLTVFDVDELPTHGGSLRLYASRASTPREVRPAVAELLRREADAHLTSLAGYQGFADQVRAAKLDLVEFLLSAAREGKTVAGYGAPGKSATLLHSCSVGKDLIPYTVDRNPYKQGRYLPGTRIPIYAPDHIRRTRPDYVLILPWNLKDELLPQLSYVREWGGRLVVPIPKLTFY